MSEFKALTPIHWDLYRYVEFKTLGVKETVSKREIYEHLLANGHDVYWHDSPKAHDHFPRLWNLVNEINESTEVDKIIVFDHDGNYRLGNEKETLAHWHSYYVKMEKARERHLAILQKIKRNGQGKLLSNQGVEITEQSLAKLYHETFNEEVSKGNEEHPKA